MNVIRVMGGLGNQLFQYAFGKAQMQNGISVGFDVAGFYGNDPKNPPKRLKKWPRYYRLDYFNTTVNKVLLNPKLKTITEANKPMDIKLLNTHPFNFDGYWQFPAYTLNILPLLRKEFTLKKEWVNSHCKSLIADMQKEESISVHVRRGDYVFQKGFYNLPFGYYVRAIREIPGTHLFIFSDDIPWCKEKFTNDIFDRKITFVEGLEDYQDFELMKHCKHHVIANSTMSWWVAWLEDREDSIIVVPSGWTSGARELNQLEKMKEADKLHYKETWIKL